jgi:hypothetical protein
MILSKSYRCYVITNLIGYLTQKLIRMESSVVAEVQATGITYSGNDDGFEAMKLAAKDVLRDLKAAG